MSKVCYAWKYFEYSFKGVCIGLTIAMIALCGYTYYLDADATVVSFRGFYQTPNGVYPAASICITSPYEQPKLDFYGNNVTTQNYSDFVSGHLWSDSPLVPRTNTIV